MNKVVVLKDQRVVTLRPLAADDVERSLAFFTGLDAEERKYLRRDVTQRELVQQRIEEVLQQKAHRIVALFQDRIVADGTLEPERFKWADGIAEIRIIVAPDFRRCGLGLRLARELYVLAHQRDVARINARMMAPQVAVRAIFRKLGFDEEFVIPRHVKDRDGNWQDLVIMRCDLAVLMSSGGEVAAPPEAQAPPASTDLMVTEFAVLKKYALRWAILAAWDDELQGRGVATSTRCESRLEESRVKIASGCFGSCHIGCLLADIEAELVSADASTEDSKVDAWIELLGKAMNDPEVALGLTAVKFRYSDCVAGGCACGAQK